MHPSDKSGINYLKTYLIRGPGPQNRPVFPKDISTLILEYAQRDELIQLAKHLVSFLDSNFDLSRYKSLILMRSAAPKRKNLDFIFSSYEWDEQKMDEKVATLRNWATQPTKGSFKTFFESYQAIIQFLASPPFTDMLNCSPLMYASRYADLSVVNALLSKVDSINSQDNLGWTALMVAAIRGNDEIVMALLEKGANPNLATFTDDELVGIKSVSGTTALIEAVSMRHLKVVITLLNHGVNPNCANAGGSTPLIYAANTDYTPIESRVERIQRHKNEAEIVKALLEKNAEVNAVDMWSETALFKAVRNGNVEVVKALLEKNPNLEQKNYEDKTVIYYAKLDIRQEVRPLIEQAVAESEKKKGLVVS